MSINPCEGCLVEPVCTNMCPRVIEYYLGTLRKRGKEEIEEATGYTWCISDDAFSTGVVDKIKIPEIEKNNIIPNIRIKPFQKVNKFKSFINLIKKGLKLCRRPKNKSILNV
jgi:hypothetical protein